MFLEKQGQQRNGVADQTTCFVGNVEDTDIMTTTSCARHRSNPSPPILPALLLTLGLPQILRKPNPLPIPPQSIQIVHSNAHLNNNLSILTPRQQEYKTRNKRLLRPPERHRTPQPEPESERIAPHPRPRIHHQVRIEIQARARTDRRPILRAQQQRRELARGVAQGGSPGVNGAAQQGCDGTERAACEFAQREVREGVVGDLARVSAWDVEVAARVDGAREGAFERRGKPAAEAGSGEGLPDEGGEGVVCGDVVA
jgi:hypothetical protein